MDELGVEEHEGERPEVDGPEVEGPEVEGRSVISGFFPFLGTRGFFPLSINSFVVLEEVTTLVLVTCCLSIGGSIRDLLVHTFLFREVT